jgi:EmrB/QacA subfamily drug resistance transporter
MSNFVSASCDAAVVQAAQAQRAPVRHPNLVLATTILASGLAFVDGSVVNVGLPAIRASLGADSETLQWVVNAYLLPLSALLLLGGAAGDHFGRKRLLILGIAIFALASGFCAIASSMLLLLLARGVQGVGAAILLPNSLAILGDAFTSAERGRAIGIWAALGAAIGAVGPVLGGWLIDTVGWRMIFLLNLPLAIAAIALALAFVENAQRGAKRVPLDVIGGLLATSGLGALTWGLTIGSGRTGWTNEAIAAFAAGLALLLMFVWLEGRQRERAMMPLALFVSSTFTGLTLLTFFLYGALGGLLVLLPYMLIVGEHYSGTAAGAALVPLPLVLACASPMMGTLADRVGSRLPLTLGPLIVAVGFCLLLWIDSSTSYWTGVFPAVVLIALGMSGAAAPLTAAVLKSVDAAHTGSASGFNSAVSRLGGLLATAMLGAVLGASGDALIGEFRIAAIAGAAISVAASLSAFFLVRDARRHFKSE